jgi:protease-4
MKAPGVRYAQIEIRGLLPDRLPSVYLFETRADTLFSLISRIHRASRDESISGLVVRVRSFGAGFAKAQEIRRALLACREAGKEVICYLEDGSNLGYYLATGADRIVIPPTGLLMLVGLRSEALFARGLLDKLGIQAEFVQAGRYKSAGETFTREGPSPAFREALESLIDDLYHQLLGAIAEGRGVPLSRAATMVRNGPYAAVAAREEGLVDRVAFADEVVGDLKARHGEGLKVVERYALPPRSESSAQSVSLFSMLMGGSRPATKRIAGPAIAVIYASGPIVMDDGGDLGLGEDIVVARRFVKTIREAAEDDRIKAIVLRVDSPGGSASACDTIWRELRRADAAKPVLASLSDVAASGGYYIAAGCRSIHADPGTLTGSIGVFGGKLVIAGLLDKIGVNVYAVERGGDAAIFSSLEGLSETGRRKLQKMLEQTYRIFIERVAETRPGLSVSAVDRVAQGRVWTGDQALERGLADKAGTLRDAIADAKREAGIAADEPVQLLHLPPARSLMELVLFGDPEATAEDRVAAAAYTARAAWLRSGLVPELAPYVRALMVLEREPALCLLPAVIRVR